MKGKFLVSTYYEVNEDSWSEVNYRGDDPRLALEVWAEAEPKNRTCVSIDVLTREHAMELITYAYENMNWFNQLCDERKVSYNQEYLDEAIGKEYQTGCESFYETPHKDEYDYYRDQVHPFDLG